MSLLSLSFVQSRKLTTNPHAPGTSIPCTFRTSGGRGCSPVAAARASSMSRVSPAAFEDSCRPRLLSSPTEDASLTSGLVHSARWPQMSSVYNVKYTHFFGRGGGDKRNRREEDKVVNNMECGRSEHNMHEGGGGGGGGD
jgi:hypothetical protein